ncbi:MAG: hypothetical protein JNM18_23480 [Planctomycetaceae bacterium]|nr:hypothetical protein [Planctomycetaceae bacterium]
MRTAAVILSFLLCWAGALQAEDRAPFLRELSALLLASDGPVQTDKGWLGVAIDHQAIPDFERVFKVYRPQEGHQLEILRAIDALDYPLSVSGGLVKRETASISLLWKDVLLHVELEEAATSPAALPALHRPPDRVEAVRDDPHPRTPLHEKFLVARGQHNLLSLAVLEESGAWRLRDDLNHFSSLGEAFSGVVADWSYFGGKLEVGAALWVNDLKTSPLIRAQERFDDHNLRPESRQPALKVWLSPPPDAWAGMGSWLTCRSRTFKGAGSVIFQLARVRVMRPWFSIDDLIDKRLRLSADWLARNPDYVLSAGGTPTLMDYPTGGQLNSYVDELLLVRNIVYDERGRDPEHPLSFAYDDVNLLGYVVRTLPRISSKEK